MYKFETYGTPIGYNGTVVLTTVVLTKTRPWLNGSDWFGSIIFTGWFGSQILITVNYGLVLISYDETALIQSMLTSITHPLYKFFPRWKQLNIEFPNPINLGLVF